VAPAVLDHLGVPGLGTYDPFAALTGSLSKSAGAAYNFLRSAALNPSNLSKSSIITSLKEAGLGVRRQTALDIIDLTRNKADLNQFFRAFGSNAPIPNVLHTLSPTIFKGGNKVQYLVGTNSDNPLIPSAIYVNAPYGLSANQIYAKAIAAFTYEQGSGMSPSDLNDVVFTIDDARYSSGAPASEGFSDNTVYSGA
jgi:hypothetical protein